MRNRTEKKITVPSLCSTAAEAHCGAFRKKIRICSIKTPYGNWIFLNFVFSELPRPERIRPADQNALLFVPMVRVCKIKNVSGLIYYRVCNLHGFLFTLRLAGILIFHQPISGARPSPFFMNVTFHTLRLDQNTTTRGE